MLETSLSREQITNGKIIGEQAWEFGVFAGIDVSLEQPDGKRVGLAIAMNSTLYYYMLELINKDQANK